jgi:hypothetical protein
MNDCQLLKKDSDTWSYATALEQSSHVKAISITRDLYFIFWQTFQERNFREIIALNDLKTREH